MEWMCSIPLCNIYSEEAKNKGLEKLPVELHREVREKNVTCKRQQCQYQLRRNSRLLGNQVQRMSVKDQRMEKTALRK